MLISTFDVSCLDIILVFIAENSRLFSVAHLVEDRYSRAETQIVLESLLFTLPLSVSGSLPSSLA